VGLPLGLREQVPGAPDDDLDLVLDVVADELVEAQGAGNAVDEREHVRAERVLQLGVLVEVVEDDLGDGVPLEDDDDPQPGLVGGVVAQVRDPLHPPGVDQVRDLRGEVVRVDLVGQLIDDEAGTALDLLDVHHRAHDDLAAPGAVGVLDAAGAHDEPAGREVRSLDPQKELAEQLVVLGPRVL
jgi:hypothetical protein